MYEKGDYVVCGQHGICRVQDITNPDFSDMGGDKLYYVLEPLCSKGSKIYSPVDSKKVLMRRVMSKEEVENLIDGIPQIEALWIGSEKMREEQYKAAMLTCEPVEWVRIIKTLYRRARDRVSQGKKITATDERYLKLAEDGLYSELCFVLGRGKDEMTAYIRSRVEQ